MGIKTSTPKISKEEQDFEGDLNKLKDPKTSREEARIIADKLSESMHGNAAFKTHPERYQEILADLKTNKVEINFSEYAKPWEGMYGPPLSKGGKGSLRIHPNADISTIEHEYQHFLDDKAAGYPGYEFYFGDTKQPRIDMEKKAYQKEIQIAKADKNLSDKQKVVKIRYLEALLQLEINKIIDPYK